MGKLGAAGNEIEIKFAVQERSLTVVGFARKVRLDVSFESKKKRNNKQRAKIIVVM